MTAIAKGKAAILVALFTILSGFVALSGFAEEKALDAEQALKQWEDSLNEGDLEGILGLYASDAVLWGTFSEVIRDDPGLIRGYFEALLQKKNVGVTFGATVHRVYGDVHVFSGAYDFYYEDGGSVRFPSRFTFVICKVEDGSYRIVQHHSSLMPGQGSRQ